MCRYGFTEYKPHYACFNCRKTFKRRLPNDIFDENSESKSQQAAKCPDCGELMADMGLDFKSPKRVGKKAWHHLENLYTAGIAFHSCGCGGPGYIPKDRDDLISYLTDKKSDYIDALRHWRREKINAPTDEKRMEAQQGIDYWNERIKAIDESINTRF